MEELQQWRLSGNLGRVIGDTDLYITSENRIRGDVI